MRAKVDSKPIEKPCPEPIDTSVKDILEQCSRPGIHPSMLNKVMIGDKMIFCRGASDE